jgi:hypothetical protein
MKIFFKIKNCGSPNHAYPADADWPSSNPSNLYCSSFSSARVVRTLISPLRVVVNHLIRVEAQCNHAIH